MAGPSAIVCDAYKAEQDRIAQGKKGREAQKASGTAEDRMTILSWEPGCMVRYSLQR